MPDAIDSLAAELRTRAVRGVWIGRGSSAYFESCRVIEAILGVQALCTRDVGHHTSGWWKNPDYERCWHLSLTFFDQETGGAMPRNRTLTDRILRALYGRRRRWLWCEPPYSLEGKRKDVWHYRLFCDAAWRPIKPRGEVYGRELTEAGWLSWSDLQACVMAQAEGGKLLRLPPKNDPLLALA